MLLWLASKLPLMLITASQVWLEMLGDLSCKLSACHPNADQLTTKKTARIFRIFHTNVPFCDDGQFVTC
jgi:hypothetical protein